MNQQQQLTEAIGAPIANAIGYYQRQNIENIGKKLDTIINSLNVLNANMTELSERIQRVEV